MKTIAFNLFFFIFYHVIFPTNSYAVCVLICKEGEQCPFSDKMCSDIDPKTGFGCCAWSESPQEKRALKKILPQKN